MFIPDTNHCANGPVRFGPVARALLARFGQAEGPFFIRRYPPDAFAAAQAEHLRQQARRASRRTGRKAHG